MRSRFVLDGNAFYEVDEECQERKKKLAEKAEKQQQKNTDRKEKQSPIA